MNINYDLSKVERARFSTMKHMIGHKNYGLVIDRQVFTDNWSHIQIVRNMVDNRLHYSRHGITELCPMLLYEESGSSPVPNVSRELIEKFEEATALKFSMALTEENDKFDVLDLFDYCYAILNSSEYVGKYLEQLKIDFPRVPLPSGKEAFIHLAQAGAFLRELHLLELPVDNSLGIEFLGTGNNEVTRISYRNNRLSINNCQYFTNISNDLYEFCFAGYHGLKTWFKVRKGLRLSQEDINHVIKVYNVFNMTAEFTPTIDKILDEYNMI